jgi:hypothetical protein
LQKSKWIRRGWRMGRGKREDNERRRSIENKEKNDTT